MKTVVAIGELLIDFVPQQKGCALDEVVQFERVAGGAPANVATAVARLGGEAKMISQVGEDAFGTHILKVLRAANVDISSVFRTNRANTALAFVSLDAANIDQFFADDEIDLLYINFCDPWPRKKNAKRRLTYHTFLEKYKKVLKLGGQIHFKTDNANLFAWSLPEMESCFLELRNVTDDLHANGPVGIMTGYEEKFYALGTPIHRVEAVVVTKQPRPADAKEPEEAEAGEDA